MLVEGAPVAPVAEAFVETSSFDVLSLGRAPGVALVRGLNGGDSGPSAFADFYCIHQNVSSLILCESATHTLVSSLPWWRGPELEVSCLLRWPPPALCCDFGDIAVLGPITEYDGNKEKLNMG